MDDVTGLRFKRLVADLIANPEDQDVRDKMVNLRAQIWKIVCRVGDLQQDMLDEYEEERKRRGRLI